MKEFKEFGAKKRKSHSRPKKISQINKRDCRLHQFSTIRSIILTDFRFISIEPDMFINNYLPINDFII